MKKRICIIDCGSKKTKDIVRIAEKTNYLIDIWFLYYPEINDFKLDVDKNKFQKMKLLQEKNNEIVSSNFDKNFIKGYDYLIFSGGGIIEKIQNDIKTFFSFLKEIEIPVLGICFGHQIIGLVYGAEVFYMKMKVSGKRKTTFLKRNTLVKNTLKEANFEKNHSEAISLPKNFELLASSKTCKVEMIAHKKKYIFGTQFHPEVSGVIGENIILKFLKL